MSVSVSASLEAGFGRASPRRFTTKAAAVLVTIVAFAGSFHCAAAARDFTAGPLTVEQPWSRATPHGTSVAIGYLVIRNGGDTPDRLATVTTDVSETASPHTMTMKNGIMIMRPVSGGVVIPAHGTLTFKPGGDHLMLQGLKRPLKKGDTFSATLTFEKAGPVPVVFEVEGIGAQAPTDASHPTAAPKS